MLKNIKKIFLLSLVLIGSSCFAMRQAALKLYPALRQSSRRLFSNYPDFTSSFNTMHAAHGSYDHFEHNNIKSTFESHNQDVTHSTDLVNHPTDLRDDVNQRTLQDKEDLNFLNAQKEFTKEDLDLILEGKNNPQPQQPNKDPNVIDVTEVNNTINNNQLQSAMGIAPQSQSIATWAKPADWIQPKSEQSGQHSNGLPQNQYPSFDALPASSLTIDNFSVRSSGRGKGYGNDNAALYAAYKAHLIALDKELFDADFKPAADQHAIDKHAKESSLKHSTEIQSNMMKAGKEIDNLRKEYRSLFIAYTEFIKGKNPDTMSPAACKYAGDLLGKMKTNVHEMTTKQACLDADKARVEQHNNHIKDGLSSYKNDIKSFSDSDFADDITKIKNNNAKIGKSIENKYKLLHCLESELAKVEKHLKQCKSSNIFTYVLAKLNHNEHWLKSEKDCLVTYIKNLIAEITQNEGQAALNEQKIAYAREMALHEQELQDTLWQNLGISADARALISKADAQLAHFEQLRADEQQQIVDLLNHGAQEQKTINNPACDKVIIATAKVADTACQAYHKGNSELGSTLVTFGHTIIDCAAAYAKGAIQGVGNNIQHKLDHPMQALGQLAIGVVAVAALPLAPVASTVILGASVAAAVVDVTHKLANLPLIEACQKAGEMSGDFAADCVILNKTINAASSVAKIVATETIELMNVAKQELAAMGKFTKAEIDAFIKSEKLIANSIEGVEITFNAKKADLTKAAESLHSEMSSFDKGKNAVKSEGAGAGSSTERKGTFASSKQIEYSSFGGYEDAGYHHIQSKGNIKSMAPKNGASAFKESVVVENNGGLMQEGKRRVGVSDGEYVVFDRTSKGITPDKDIFHGHVRSWTDLGPAMQQALKKAGLTNNNGKIIR